MGGTVGRNIGSSPLSRGIRIGRPGHLIHIGIIPALAGNTFSFMIVSAFSRDHPRSRGEYFALPYEKVC